MYSCGNVPIALNGTLKTASMVNCRLFHYSGGKEGREGERKGKKGEKEEGKMDGRMDGCMDGRMDGRILAEARS